MAALALAVTNVIMLATVMSRPSVSTILSSVSRHFNLGVVGEPVYDLKVVVVVQLAYVVDTAG